MDLLICQVVIKAKMQIKKQLAILKVVSQNKKN
jgi:hypothetical protein